jgi:hypothetical protein
MQLVSSWVIVEENEPHSNQDEIRAYDILLKRHINEDRLMTERMSTFLLASSFLFLAFVTLTRIKDAFRLCVGVCAVGIILSFLAFSVAGRTRKGLDFWDGCEKHIETGWKSFAYMKSQKICLSDGTRLPIIPSSVRENAKHGCCGWLFKWETRCVYQCYPLLVLGLWVGSLIWVNLN